MISDKLLPIFQLNAKCIEDIYTYPEKKSVCREMHTPSYIINLYPYIDSQTQTIFHEFKKFEPMYSEDLLSKSDELRT